jgi:hypothetical protein
MNKKSLIITLVVAVIALGVGFFGGTTYAHMGRQTFAAGQFGSMRSGMNQGFGTGRTGGAMGGAVTGQVLSIDAGSFTVKLPDGGSKLVLIGSSTAFMKSSEGSLADLSAGAQVFVTGPVNTDGSVTAQSVRIGGPTGR